MHALLHHCPLTLVLGAALGLGACGSSNNDTKGGSDAAPSDATPATGVQAHGLFEVHYITGATSSSSYTDMGGFMYDGTPTAMVIWDKKSTDGSCSLYVPRTPFCDSCAPGDVCVDTNVCRTPPSYHEVGDLKITGLNAPSGTNPLPLSDVNGSYGPTETLPVPPCVEGTELRLDGSGKGDYPAFSIQSKCIAPLAVLNSSITIESGKTLTLTWTPPPTVTTSRIGVVFDLSHHGGSKGQIICDAGDTGSLQVSGTLLASLMALGVTGYPTVAVTRSLVGTSAVGAGQAELKVYSDLSFVAQIPGLVSCQSDADCLTPGQTCQVPGQMCGVSCVSNTDCPSGQTCQTTTKICK
jgi:hypothetical protein